MFSNKVLRGTLLFIVGLVLGFIGISLFISGMGLVVDSVFLIAGLVAAMIAFYTLII